MLVRAIVVADGLPDAAGRIDTEVAGIEFGEVLKRRRIGEIDPAAVGRDQAAAAQRLHHTVDVHRRQPERIGKLFLRHRKVEPVEPFAAVAGPFEQFAQQMREPRVGAQPAEIERPLRQDTVFNERQLRLQSRDAWMLIGEREYAVAAEFGLAELSIDTPNPGRSNSKASRLAMSPGKARPTI